MDGVILAISAPHSLLGWVLLIPLLIFFGVVRVWGSDSRFWPVWATVGAVLTVWGVVTLHTVILLLGIISLIVAVWDANDQRKRRTPPKG